MLVAFAERLMNYCRGKAQCFRLDGAEFALTFRKKLSRQEVEEHVNALSYLCRTAFNIDDYTIELGVSPSLVVNLLSAIAFCLCRFSSSCGVRFEEPIGGLSVRINFLEITSVPAIF